ncbi:MAG: DUF1080 domain-containing protein [Akkermansiaceae bacterium]|jgi:hypothetical protein|nr:DUF1080 domain-containing protein [Akkermansiaceae bacterium]
MKIITALFALSLAAQAQIQGVAQPLFNGKDLTGWKGEGYEVKDGTIVATAQGRNLVTEKTFANYILDFEFQLQPGANNGIGIHYPGEGDAAYVGMEVQVLDDTSPDYAKLEPGQYHGSIYKLVPAKRGHLKPVGEWNLQRITVSGPLVRVELNGTVIAEGNLDALSKAHPDHAGAKRRSGHIAFCGHGAGVAFRNISICEMPPAANIEGVKAAGFTQIFDGTTLTGWKVDKGSEGHWVAANGVIKYDGRSEAAVKDLWSEKSYKDFTLVFDWRWGAPGPMMKRPVIGPDGKETGEMVEVQELDSGIYLRGSSKSQVNLWNWPCGSGEVYGYRTDGNQPAEVRAAVTPIANADKPVGEWNRMMITLKGEVLSVTLNGKTVIENASLPGTPAEGPIGLQHHGAAIDFANIWIKEL